MDIVFYDGSCGLCSKSVQYLLRHGRKSTYYFAPLQGATAQEFLVNHPAYDKAIDSIFFLQDERLYSKSDAVLILAKELGGIHRLLSVGRIFPKRFRDWVYDLIAANRKRFFQDSSCLVVDKELRTKRFLA